MALGFWNVAQRDPDRIAVVEPDGQEMRAGHLLSRANRLVRGLRKLGLERGDSVAVLLPNCVEMIELYAAVAQAGLYLTPMNHHLTVPEIAYIAADCEAKAFVCHERFAEAGLSAAGEASLPERIRFVTGSAAVDGLRAYQELIDEQPDSPPDDRSSGAVMTYTAGTTGRPKGVRRPLAMVDPDTMAEMYTWLLWLFGIQPEAGNVHLTVSPLYHTAVMNFTTTSLHDGHTVVLMERWTPEGTLERIENYRVTTSHMVPTQFHRLLQLPEDVRQRFDVSSLTHVIHSAAPCPVEVKRRMLEWWGPVIYEYYAATEGGGTLVTPEQWLQKPGTVGPPWPNSEIRILDEEDRPAPPGQPGTVWIKMGDYTFEYHRDREKTERTWKDGFFTVGDIGYLDDDGWLFLCDRKADVIISGGVNIYPAETEGVLLGHQAVQDVAVVGIPNEDWGEQVHAVVELRSGAQASADDLIGFCRERLAAYKCPRSVEFVDALPRDPNGKLSRSRLRERYWAGRERAI